MLFPFLVMLGVSALEPGRGHGASGDPRQGRHPLPAARDRRVPAELGQESQASSCVKECMSMSPFSMSVPLFVVQSLSRA